MRKPIAAIAVAAVAVLAYGALPYWTLWRMKSAVDARDAAALTEMADWAALRAGVKVDITAALAARAAARANEPGQGGLGALLGAALAPALVDRAVDELVTPEGVLRLIHDGRALRAVTKTKPNGSSEPAAPEAAAQRFALRHAFFTGASDFLVEATRPLPGGRELRVGAELHRDGLSWRVVRVRLPVDLLGAE